MFKDFFISYTGVDEQIASWIAWTLEDAAFSVVFQKWDFRTAGKSVIGNINQATIESERTIAVISPEYFTSKFTTPEWETAVSKDPSGEQGLLIPVIVRPCNIEGVLKRLAYISFLDLDEEQAMAALLDGVKTSRAKPTTKPTYKIIVHESLKQKPRFPVQSVPFRRNTNFTGREEILNALRSSFGTTSNIQVIYGLGGVGKSQIATEYCYRNSGCYDVVWWLRAEKASSLTADYSALAGTKALNLPEQNAKEQEQVIKAVRECLNHRNNWLLVLDNATNYQSIAGYLPQASGGHILITSRNPDWRRIGTVHEISTWPRPESISFLNKRTGEKDENTADKIAEVLGDLPLALEQAGAYIDTKRTGYVRYFGLLKSPRWAELMRRSAKPVDYPESILTTWILALEEIHNVPYAQETLECCCMVAPDSIPRTLVDQSLEAYISNKEQCSPIDEFVIDDAIEELNKYSLVKTEIETMTVHRLVQAVVRDRMGADSVLQCQEAILKVLSERFPDKGHKNPSCWPECEKLLLHAEKVTAEVADNDDAWQESAELLNKMGSYHRGRGYYTIAEPLYRRTLLIREAKLGPEHTDVAQSLNNLAELLRIQGMFDEAEPLYRRALLIREAKLGPEHPDLAQSLNNLALLLQAKGKFDDVEHLYRRALLIRKAKLGAEHTDVAQSLNNLAAFLQTQGKYDDAEPLYHRALLIREAKLGPEHTDVAQSLNNLAELLRIQAKYDNAEQHCRRALLIREAKLGPEHPDVAQSLNNLAALLQAQGKYDEAEPLYHRALLIWEAQLEPEHPDVATSLNNLALLLQAQGKYDEVEPLYRRALLIREAKLGPEHPDVAMSLNNLALLLQTQGKYDEAEPLYRHVLQIWEAQLGPEHPYVASSLNNLAELLRVREKYDEAEPLYRHVLQIWKAQLGRDHPYVATILNNLALLLQGQGNYVEAESFFRRAVAIVEQQPDENHPNTTTIRNNLAALLTTKSDALMNPATMGESP